MPVVRFAVAGPALFAALSIMTCPVRAQVPAAVDVAGPSGTTVEEIVVTAQRRTQSMQDVPLSVSAISGEKLAEGSIRDAQDLLGNIPGLSADSAGEGRRNMSMRGISTQAGLPVVGVYLDDVPLVQSGAHGATSAIEPDFFDLNRIEVLRGPQGTLYGASSLGGTLRYITNQPDATSFAAKVATEAYVTEHGSPSSAVKAMVNVPIGDRLAARVVASYASTGGYIDRLVGDISGPGRTAVGPVQRVRDVNNAEQTAVRGLLRYDATDSIHITAGFFGQKLREAALSAYDMPPGGLNHLSPVDIGDPYRDNFTLPSLTIEAEVGGIKIVSTSAYLRRTGSFAEDPTEATEEAVIGPLREAGVPLPDTTFSASYHQTADKRQFTQELRIMSAEDQRIQWVAGAYYQDQDDLRNDYYFIPGFYEQYGDLPQALDLFGAPINPHNDFYSSDQYEDLQQTAVFADVTVPLTSRLEGTVGLRKFWYSTSFHYDARGTTNGPPFIAAGEAKDDGWQPRAVLSFRPASEKLLYASYAKGFRPGGGNIVIPVQVCGPVVAPTQYQPDTVRSYELGAKTRWFDERVQLNVAAYHLIWDDLQQGVGLDCGYGYTVNAGRAESDGAELEFQFALPHGIQIDGGISYIDATIKESDANPQYVGMPPQSVAPWTGSLNLEYELPMPAELEGYVRVGSTYVGRSYADVTRDSGRVQGDYFLANLRLGVSRNAWNASIFVDNLLDERAVTSWYASNNYQVSGLDRLLTNRPRSVGVSFEYRIR